MRQARACVWALASAMLAAGCAEVPTAPSTVPAATAPAPALTSRRREDLVPVIAARRQRAQQYRAAGDLARAEAELQVLSLLAPDATDVREERNAVRAEIARVRDEQLRAGNAALGSGDAQRAVDAFLRVLAADPENAEAAHALREMDRRRIGRIQSERAARVQQQEQPPALARNATRAAPSAGAPAPNDTALPYEVEQRIEMFQAGDTAGGLRELRAYVDANPRDRNARVRIGAAVFDRARELEGGGQREQALGLYEAAVSLRGDTPAAWNGRITALHKALSNEYYDRGTRAMRTDLPAAITALEASVRYDPANARAVARLAEARTMQARLNAIAPSAKSK